VSMKGSIVNQIEVNRYFTKGEDPYTASSGKNAPLGSPTSKVK